MTHHKVPFCQSCSMPMMKSEDFGSNADGSPSEEYCRFCFSYGAFTEPGITLSEMIAKCASIMQELHVPFEQIEQTKAFIPMLRRWR
jgi:hypothetical protein